MSLTRIISVTTLVAIGYILFAFVPEKPFAAGLTVILILGLVEYFRMFQKKLGAGFAILGVLLGAIYCFTIVSGGLNYGVIATSIVLLILLGYSLFHKGEQPGTLVERLSLTFIGIIYIGLLMGHLPLLRLVNNGQAAFAFVVILTWIRDISAYGGGRLWQPGHRVWPAVSPRKSIEGMLAGIIGTVGIAFLVGSWLLPRLEAGHLLLLGMLIGVAGQFGDLTESLFKRVAGVKDSSGIIPGQGGILDSFDGFAFTAPLAYYYLIFLST